MVSVDATEYGALTDPLCRPPSAGRRSASSVHALHRFAAAAGRMGDPQSQRSSEVDAARLIAGAAVSAVPVVSPNARGGTYEVVHA